GPGRTRGWAWLVERTAARGAGRTRRAWGGRQEESTDPAASPETVRLAERLGPAIAGERSIAIAPQGGLEIALRGMLAAAGVRHVPSGAEGDVVLRRTDGGANGLALTLFKALQLLDARELDTA